MSMKMLKKNQNKKILKTLKMLLQKKIRKNSSNELKKKKSDTMNLTFI